MFFINGNVQSYSFCPPKKDKSTKHVLWCTRNLHAVVSSSGSLNYNGLQNVQSKVF